MISSALGNTLGSGELRTRVGDDRPPAEEPRRGAHRLGRVDGAVDEQARRRPVDLREHAGAVELEDAVRVLADELLRLAERYLRHAVAVAFAALQHERVRAEPITLDHREEDGALLALHRLQQAVDSCHSSRSTKTSISPPHGSPTSQASSSAIP